MKSRIHQERINRALKKNRFLKNIHAGRRCFLVGNGPSLNTQDISLLRNEVAIVASSFFRHPQAETVNPGYWVFADPMFWTKPEKYFMPAFGYAREKNISTRLFVPSGGFDYFAGFDRGPLIDLHYYYFDNRVDITSPIDFSRGIPPFGQNTMTVCLMLAIHLGCNPIYFMGCDRDYWNMSKEEYEIHTVRHFYEDPGQNKCVEHISWEEWLEAKKRTEYEYEQLKSYARTYDISIYNATAGGQFDQFPRVNYESLFPCDNILDPRVEANGR